MELKTATIDDLLSWQPCYDESQIRKWAGDATEFTALDVLQHPDIKPQDKLWVVLRPEMLDDRTTRLFACNCAEHVLHLYENKYPNDSRPRNAITVARRYANGQATDQELDAAWAAAWAARDARDAAWAAARAARAAARDAAWAARAAAWAARAAAWAAWAARDAAWAAWAAEREWQIQALIQQISPAPAPDEATLTLPENLAVLADERAEYEVEE